MLNNSALLTDGMKTISILVRFAMLSQFPCAFSLVNRTIDDLYGDEVTKVVPIYTGAWVLGSTCSWCWVNSTVADVNQAFDQTWHDTTYHPGDADQVITIQFTGTAIYVFNLIANYIPGIPTFTNLTFAVDGKMVGAYSHEPEDKVEILYHVPVFTYEGLANVSHTLEVRATGTNATLVLFDYAIYTVDIDDEQSSPSTFPVTVSTQSTISSTTPPSSTTSSVVHPSSASNAISSTIPVNNPPVPSQLSSISSSSSTSPALHTNSAPLHVTSSTMPVASADTTQNSSSVHSSADMGPIVGGSVSGAVLVVLAAFAFHDLRKRRLRRFGRTVYSSPPPSPVRAYAAPQFARSKFLESFQLLLS